MNHIYKSIFNKALGVFTAVPEFASAHGKGSERTVVGRVAKGTAGFAASALAISVGLALTSTSAVAGPGIYINDGADNGCIAVPDAAPPYVGIYGLSNGAMYPAASILGTGQQLPPVSFAGLDVMKPCLSSGANATAVEKYDSQTNRTLFYGKNAPASVNDNGAKNLTLGGRLDVNSGIIGVGDRGTNGTGATNSIRMGTGTTLDEANKKTNAISIGVDAGASADNAIAMGKSASAAGQRAIAMGENSLAGNQASMALGYNSSAKGLAQVSIGQGAGTLKNTTDSGAADATFIGNYAGADSASPIGNLRGVAVGTNAGRNLVSGAHNIAVGYDAGKSIEGSNNVAIGYNTGSNVNGDLNFAGGREAGNSVKGEKNIALGYISGQNIEGNDNTTVGYSSGNNVTGWGNFAGASKAGQFVEGYNNVAIGYQAGMGTADNLLKTSGGVSISTNSKAKTSFSIAIGDSSSAGDDSTGAHGGGRLAIAIGQNANANFYHAIALGHSSRVSPATGQSAEDGIAIGSGALVDNYKGIAVGAYSRAKGRQSTVIANNVRDSNYSTASGDRSQVYGAETTVSGNNSVAIGDTNTVASARTYAIGNNINAAVGTDDSLAFGTKAAVGGNNAIAMGNTATASASGSVAISNQSKAKTTYSIALGERAVAGDDSTGALNNGEAAIAIGREASANVYNGIALGKQATVKKDSSDGIAIGSETKVNAYKGTAIGAFSEANGSQALAIGNNKQGQSSVASGERSQVIGVESNVSGQDSTAIGYKNTVASDRTYAIGNNINAAAGTPDSLAFGTRASVGGASSIALGSNTKTYTDDSISIGSFSESGGPATTGNLLGTKAIAIGYETKALATSAVALGYGATVENGHDSIAIGVKAKTSTQKSTTIGSYSEARGDQSTVIANNYDSKAGKAVSIASGARSQVYGAETTVSGNNSVAIGDTNTVAGARTYAIGNNINVAAGVDDALAFGTKAAVGGANAIALGNTASAAINNAIAVGQASSSTGNSAIAIGTKASAQGDSALAHGVEAQAIAQSSTAIGFRAKAQGYEQISIGSNAGNSSPANAENYGAVFIGRHAGSGNNSATGNTDGVSIGSNAGQNAVSGIKNVAIGPTTGQYVEGSQNLALSTNAGNSVKGDNNLAMMVGAGNNIEGGNNIAIGTNANSGTPTAKRVVTNSISMGANTQATSNNTIAIGPQARALAADAVALGLGSLSNHANSVALGAGSVTSAAHTGDYTLNTSYTAAGQPVAANGTVSVGSAGKERQIQNVAAGVISATSTDAINGSQLYATNNYMNNFAGGVKNVLGGDAAVDNAGNLTMSNIGGTGKGNVHEAIAAVKGVADTAVQEVESENPTALSVKKDGTKVTLTPNFITGDLVNADGTVNAPATADEGKLVSAKTVADALKANHFVVDTKGNTETGSEADAKVGSGNKVTFEAGNNLVAKQANTANGGATVKFSLKDDISLNSVTAGTGANQVVLGNDGVKVGGNTYINNDGLNANSKVISNVADGVAPTDAVNKGQLDAVKNVADSAVQSVDVATNENNLVVDNNDPKNPKLRLRKAVDLDSIKLENNVGEKSFLNSAGLTIEGGPAVTRSGINANNTKVTNVTDGDVNSTSKDAVNGSQLYNVASNVADLVGPDAKIDPATGNVTVADPTKGIGETGKGTIGDAIKAVNKAATAAKTTVKEGDNITVTPTTNTDGSTTYTVATKKDLDVTSVTAGNTTVNTNGLTITGGPSVTRGGIDAGDRVISGVKAGDVSANSKEAVNGSQLYATNTKLDGVKAKADTAVQDVKSGDENALTAVKDPNTNIVTVTPKLSGDLVDADGNITAPTTPADKGKLVTAGTVAQALANTHFVVDTKATDGELDSTSQADQKIKAGNKVTLQAGKNLKAKQTNGADGAQVEFSLKDSISLTQVTAGEGDNQVVLGNDGVKVGGNTYINKDGLNANNKPISNVADGVKPTDAVNKGQLDAVKGVADSAVKSVDVANGEQNLVVDNTDPKNPKLSLKKDLTVDSVKAGDSTLNTDGLTIAGGPSVKKDGINAGNKKITGVADGNVAAGSTDAVNGGQLYNVANNVKDLIGPDATIDPATGKVTVADPAQGIAGTGKGTIGEAIKSVKDKADTAVQDIKSGDEKALSVTKAGNTYTITPNLSGDLVDADGNITAPATDADKGKLVTAGTVADALANTHFVVDTKATDGELDAASQADQKIKAGNKVTLQAGKNLKAKQTNGTNGAQVEFSLKDSISLTQVTAGTGDNQVVLGNDGVQVGGNTYINKDGLNANNKVISNVADGVNPNDAVNKGQLDAVKGVADSAVKSVDVVANENNLVVDNTDPKNPKLRLRKAVDLDSIKLENNVGEKSFLNSAGLTIEGGPAVTRSGINANNTKVTNVTDGDVNGTSKDAVNGSQLYNVASNVKDLIGPDAAIDPATGKVTVADPTKGIGGTGKGTIGDAIKHVNDAAKAAADTAKKHTTVEQGDNIVVEESTNADGGKHYKVSTAKNLNVDSVKAGDTTVNNDGVTIAGGPSVTKGGINAGGNTITNVADGVNPNDAVNKGQLDAVKNVADSAVKSVDVANGEENLVVDNTDPKNPKLSLKKDLTVDSVTAGDSTLNNDGLTIAGGPSVKKDGINAGDKKITNVEAGNVAENSKDAVNGGQLYDVAKNVADLVGPDATIDSATGKVTVADPAKGIGETGKGNIGDAIKHVNDAAKAAADTAKKHTTVEQGDNIVVEESTNADGGKHYKVSTAKNLNVDSVKAGDTTVNNDGVTIAGGPSVTKGGINAGGNTITNVADGVDAADAVNKGQLNKVDTKVSNVAQNVVNVLGGDATVNGNGDITMSNIGETGKGNINDAIKSVNDLAKKAAAEKTSVKAKEGRSNVTVTEGVNAAGGHEYTVDVERSVTNAGSNYVTVTNNHDAGTNTTTYTVDVSAKTKASLAKADSAVQGLTSKDGNLNFTKGANGNVEVSFNDNLNVKNVTTDRVQVANGPSMSKDGINAAGKAISNVANGNVAADSKDAVNGGQLHETAKSVADVIGGGATVKDGKVVAGQNGIGNTGQNTVHGAIAAINQNTANNFNQIRGDLRKMDRDLRGGIAGALATAGLPQAFRPGKSMVAAAASTYRGQSGLAIGVSRISDNGKVILKVTGNTNSRGDFGGTIGAGYQW